MKRLLTLLIALSLPWISIAQAAFFDVTTNYPYFNAIEFVQEKGFVKGYDDGTYKPNANINRAEFIKILIEARFTKTRIESCKLSSESLFIDVASNQWFAPYVCLSKQEGIIGGYPDGTFRPGQSINLAEASKIIVGSYGFQVDTVNGAAWYAPYIAVLEALSSRPDTARDATHQLTRGEMAFIITGFEMAFENLQPGESLEVSLEIPIENDAPFEGENSYQAEDSDPSGERAQLIQSVIDLTNVERTSRWLTPLTHNSILSQAAQGHAEDMLKRKFFDHITPDGISASDRIEGSGYLEPYYECQCSKSYGVGENIAKGQESAAEVVTTWMNSPDHRENILNPDFSEIGIGIIPVSIEDSNFRGYFWVQKFGDITLIK